MAQAAARATPVLLPRDSLLRRNRLLTRAAPHGATAASEWSSARTQGDAIARQVAMLALFMFRLLQQLRQIIPPDRRQGVRAVPAGLIADRNQNVAAALNPLDLAFQNPQLG